jgi:hypothetical protein
MTIIEEKPSNSKPTRSGVASQSIDALVEAFATKKSQLASSDWVMWGCLSHFRRQWQATGSSDLTLSPPR